MGAETGDPFHQRPAPPSRGPDRGGELADVDPLDHRALLATALGPLELKANTPGVSPPMLPPLSVEGSKPLRTMRLTFLPAGNVISVIPRAALSKRVISAATLRI
jgi:hypothetical protein